MTILEFLTRTADYFAKHAVDSPRLTAELLLAEALQKKRMQLYLEFESEVPETVLDQLRPLAKRRAQGEPLAYVQGFAEFAGRRFVVTPATLIPRPETELLVEAVARRLVPEHPGAVVDVGTGSGIIAVTLANRLPQRSIVAVDRCEQALAVARTNGSDCPNLTFLHGDLLDPLGNQELDWVVANLPYIPTPVIPTLSREVQREPHTALDGGSDGLDLVRRLITQSRARARGIALEIGDGQAQEVKSLLQAAGFAIEEVIQDFRQTDRIIIGTYRG